MLAYLRGKRNGLYRPLVGGSNPSASAQRRKERGPEYAGNT